MEKSWKIEQLRAHAATLQRQIEEVRRIITKNDDHEIDEALHRVKGRLSVIKTIRSN